MGFCPMPAAVVLVAWSVGILNGNRTDFFFYKVFASRVEGCFRLSTGFAFEILW